MSIADFEGAFRGTEVHGKIQVKFWSSDSNCYFSVTKYASEILRTIIPSTIISMDKSNNVLAVIGDQKLPVLQGGVVVRFEAHVISSQDYSPFGVTLSGRRWSEGYRYGFNGQEKEKDITGSDTHTSAEFWMYDTRLGRRWNLDPKSVDFVSPYVTFLNNPMYLIDIKGDTVNVYYSFKDDKGNNQRKHIFRLDHSDLNQELTVIENELPSEYRDVISNSLKSLEKPEVISIQPLSYESKADAIMMSVGASAGLLAGVGLSIDIVIPKKGPQKDEVLFYLSYQALATAGAGIGVVMGDVDVRSDLEESISAKTFAGESLTYGAGIFGLYQNVRSYEVDVPDECSIFGINCPNEVYKTYEANLYGFGGEISIYRGSSYSFYFGAIKK